MANRKVVANCLAVVGSVAAAYGIHGVLVPASCDGAGCSSADLPYGLLTGAGVTVVVLAGIMGGGVGAFLVFPAFGIGLVWAGLEVPELGSTAVLLGGAFLSVILVPVVLIPLRWARRRRVARMLAEGGQAIGTVVGIEDTGITINSNPRVRLRLRIEPIDGTPAFDGQKAITVSRLRPPYVGQRFPVWYDRDNHAKFGLGVGEPENADPEVRRLFALAARGGPRPPQGTVDPIDRLAKLNALRQAGALTDSEYETLKAKILAEEAPR